MLLLGTEQLSGELLSVFISLAGVIVSAFISVVIYLMSGRKERKVRLTSQFNQTYNKSFSIIENIKNKSIFLSDADDFYFELDYMLNDDGIKDAVLDYITEMENYFSVVLGNAKLDSMFKKLSSFALYSRWCSFYGFIIKMRGKSKSRKMFRNYIRVIDKMEKIEKIKTRISIPKNLYYVGIRKSDCVFSQYCDESKKNKKNHCIFKNSFQMFPDSSSELSPRPNQNIDGRKFLKYVENQMTKLLNASRSGKDKQAPMFMFYNPAMAYRLPVSLQKHIICLNDSVLINLLQDKITCRKWLRNNCIAIVGFQTMSGQEIRNKTFNELGNSEKYVIQSNYGGGGIGTFLCDERNFEARKNALNHLGQYIVSPYIEKSISANTHVFIAEKQTVLSPASIQIIELVNGQLCYRGADFFAFRNIDKNVRDKIRDMSIKIANLLRNKGYRGVAGIDFIIAQDGRIYCSEINARFQASSVLLDIYLSKHKNSSRLAGSVAELNLQAFNGAIKSDLCFDDEIPYSCYYYYRDNNNIDNYIKKERLFRENSVRTDTDGFDDKTETNENSYLFRAIFEHPICTVSPENTLWINDNIPVRDAPPSDTFGLKVALLNQGVRLRNMDSDIKKGVYESVDIELKSAFSHKTDRNINCATGINLAQYSPFVLDGKKGSLEYYDERIGEFEIEKDLLDENFDDVSKKILYFATDRIRIKMISGCEFKNYGIGCAFCNVPYSTKKFTREETDRALLQLKNSGIEFRHFLIGGGTCLQADIWEEIISLAKKLKADFPDKPVSLMSVLPPRGNDETSVMFRMKKAGIEEVAFNLEVCDENYAKILMPGKYKSKQIFYDTMKDAVMIFGENAVRSAIVVGIDTAENTVKEVLSMAENGITPCLSALRALPGAKANFTIHPTNAYLTDVYFRCKDALNKIEGKVKFLGPPCKRCRNNMLIE